MKEQTHINLNTLVWIFYWDTFLEVELLNQMHEEFEALARIIKSSSRKLVSEITLSHLETHASKLKGKYPSVVC